MKRVEQDVALLTSHPDASQRQIVAGFLLRANIRSANQQNELAVQGKEVELVGHFRALVTCRGRLEDHLKPRLKPCRGYSKTKGNG